ncbi:hypothetical protein, partial [Vibrio anguillarum]
KSHDLHEENSSYLEEVAAVYYSIAKNAEDWKIINCLEGNLLRSIDDISNDVLSTVLETLD